jgi:alpha-L-arabinofuranosidase
VDLKQVNTKTDEAIRPSIQSSAQFAKNTFSATLKPQSWNVFTLKSV